MVRHSVLLAHWYSRRAYPRRAPPPNMFAASVPFDLAVLSAAAAMSGRRPICLAVHAPFCCGQICRGNISIFLPDSVSLIFINMLSNIVGKRAKALPRRRKCQDKIQTGTRISSGAADPAAVRSKQGCRNNVKRKRLKVRQMSPFRRLPDRLRQTPSPPFFASASPPRWKAV